MHQVIQFVAEWTAVPVSQVREETRLGEDLGLDGDDAGEFMVEFARRFHVDLTGFEFSRHFGPEAGWCPFFSLYFLIRGSGLEPITVGELGETAEKRAWIGPIR